MSANAKLAVGLVDDDPDLRNYFKALMKSTGFPSHAFASADEFLTTFEQKRLGCILLDVRMPGMDGLELLDLLHERNIFIPVILLTGFADVRLAVRAVRRGAFDVLEKPCRDDELLARVRQALVRCEKLQDFQAERQTVAPRIAALTPRELEVLDLMVAGKKNKAIAQELGISIKTLDIHRSSIFRKMKTKTVADLVRWRLIDRADPFALAHVAMSLSE